MRRALGGTVAGRGGGHASPQTVPGEVPGVVSEVGHVALDDHPDGLVCSDTKLTAKTTACVSERPFVAVQ